MRQSSTRGGFTPVYRRARNGWHPTHITNAALFEESWSRWMPQPESKFGRLTRFRPRHSRLRRSQTERGGGDLPARRYGHRQRWTRKRDFFTWGSATTIPIRRRRLAIQFSRWI